MEDLLVIGVSSPRPPDADSQPPTKSNGSVSAAPTVELTRKLRELEVSTHALEGAHTIERSRVERYNRNLATAGVILSLIVATSVYATLAVSPEGWAKVIVGTLSVIVAVVTGLNQKGLFTDQAAAFREKSLAFGALYTKAGRIPVELEHGTITRDDAEKKLNELQEEREKLEKEPPTASAKAYQEAFEWARKAAKLHTS